MLAVIVGAHVLVIGLLPRWSRQHLRPASPEEPRGLLFFFDWSPPEEQPAPERDMAQPATLPRAPGEPAASNAITMPDSGPPPNTAIDWQREAELVARAGLEKSLAPKPRAFGEHPKSPFDKPKAHEPRAQWAPGEKRAGLDGPFPYVRLGKRCILMPPMFTCMIGKLPGPNIVTLEDMRDPNCPRSSVPQPDELSGPLILEPQ